MQDDGRVNGLISKEVSEYSKLFYVPWTGTLCIRRAKAFGARMQLLPLFESREFRYFRCYGKELRQSRSAAKSPRRSVSDGLEASGT